MYYNLKSFSKCGQFHISGNCSFFLKKKNIDFYKCGEKQFNKQDHKKSNRYDGI